MRSFSARRDVDWLNGVLRAVESAGCAVVEDMLEPAFIDECRTAMYRTQQAIATDVGRDRLDRAGELGVLRLMLKYDPLFYRFLAIPSMLEVVDRTSLRRPSCIFRTASFSRRSRRTSSRACFRIRTIRTSHAS